MELLQPSQVPSKATAGAGEGEGEHTATERAGAAEEEGDVLAPMYRGKERLSSLAPS